MVGDARGYRMVMAAIGRFLRIIPFPMDDSMDDSMDEHDPNVGNHQPLQWVLQWVGALDAFFR